MPGFRRSLFVAAAALGVSFAARTAELDWQAVNAEALAHFQTLVRFDTSDPPGNEQASADYLVKVLKDAGVEVETLAQRAHRPNVVARIRGNGRKRPVLILGHQDVVNVDPSKWQFPPFSGTLHDGWIYGRGTIDDKDNVTAGLMIMLLLKRQNLALDRDVIFLAEVGEESTPELGIQYLIAEHYDKIDAEFCFAEGAGPVLKGGHVKFAAIQTSEKIPRAIALTATGVSGHGSIPLRSNAIAHLSSAIAAAVDWQAPIKLNETTTAYFERLARISPAPQAERYRAILKQGSKEQAEAFEYFRVHEPRQASMLHTSVSPTMIRAGYRVNVIPSQAEAILDVRIMPGEDPQLALDAIRKVINDPAVRVDWTHRAHGTSGASGLDTEGFHALANALTHHYGSPVLPVMISGGTDMAYLRAKGMQCYGTGAAVDEEDAAKGFGSHSDQERVSEAELYRFIHAEYDAVTSLARSH